MEKPPATPALSVSCVQSHSRHYSHVCERQSTLSNTECTLSANVFHLLLYFFFGFKLYSTSPTESRVDGSDTGSDVGGLTEVLVGNNPRVESEVNF